MITEAMTDVIARIDSLNLGVLVTAHQGKAANELTQGRPVIVIQAPKITPLTLETGDMEWQIVVASGPATDPFKAIETMEPYLEALLNDAVLTPTAADPNTFQTIQNNLFPCYVLDCTTQHD